MQEHIRRAHPEHYISKLPATEESFQLMINTSPNRPQPSPPNQLFGNSGMKRQTPTYLIELIKIAHGHDRDAYATDRNSPAPTRILEDQYPAAATAAVALAQLHNQKPDSDWESDGVSTQNTLTLNSPSIDLQFVLGRTMVPRKQVTHVRAPLSSFLQFVIM